MDNQMSDPNQAINFKNCIMSCIASKNLSDKSSDRIRGINSNNPAIMQQRNQQMKNAFQNILNMPNLATKKSSMQGFSNAYGSFKSASNWASGNKTAAINFQNCILSCITTKNLSDDSNMNMRRIPPEQRQQMISQREQLYRSVLQTLLNEQDLTKYSASSQMMQNTMGAYTSAKNWMYGRGTRRRRGKKSRKNKHKKTRRTR